MDKCSVIQVKAKSKKRIFLSVGSRSCSFVDIVIFLMTLVMLFSPVASMADRAQGAVQAEVSRMSDTVHFEFKGAQQWDYQIQEKQVGEKSFVELRLPTLDVNTRKKLEQWSDTLVKKVLVQKGEISGQDLIKIELAGNNIEVFDYLTDQPSRLIVDFYITEKTAKTETNKASTSSSKSAAKFTAKPKPTAVAKSKDASAQRKLATADYLEVAPQGDILATEEPSVLSNKIQSGIFDGADPKFERFSIKDYEIDENAIIKSKQNVYLPFPMVLADGEHFKQLLANQPIYNIIPKSSEENKQARLLSTLFENKRHLVYLQTADWFKKKYPISQYDEIVRFMTADVHFQLWQKENQKQHFDNAIQEYKEALKRYPNSKLANRTIFLIGFSSIEVGDYFSALRTFQNFVAERPESEAKDLAQLTLAKVFLKIKRFDDAEKILQQLEKSAFSSSAKVEAAYNLGDVAFSRGQHEKAYSLYQNAIKNYPQAAANYPGAFFNSAESLFWLGKYKDSLDAARDYVVRFPDHSHAGYAMTRIGELLEILGADPSRSMGAYLETFFRYGGTPGAAAARMRLLVQKMPTMKEKEAETAIKEIRDIAKTSSLPKIDEFSTVIISDGHMARGEFDRGIDTLEKYFQAHPTSVNVDLFTNRIVRNVNKKIEQMLDRRQFLEALRTHNKYADNWLKGKTRPDMMFNLGRAFEQAGAFKEAQTLYRDALNRVYAISGSSREKELKVFERIPDVDELNLRLAQVSSQLGKASEAYDYLKSIKTPGQLAEDSQIERVELAANLLAQRGEGEVASRYLKELIENWRGQPTKVSGPTLELAKLNHQAGKHQDAIKDLTQLTQLLTDGGKVPSQEHAQVLDLLAKIYGDTKDETRLLKVYEEILGRYDSQNARQSMRYKMGEIYYKQGQLQKANETWDKLKDEKSTFWYSLAQEKIKGAEFDGNYKKYINRIPAMEGFKE